MKNFKGVVLLIALCVINAPINGAATGLSENAVKLLEASRNKQLGIMFFERGNVTDEWLMKAVGYIVNGKLTRENRQYALDQILQIIDILYGAPLRNNRNITDEQYNYLTSRVENKARDFMNKLYVGGMYPMR